MSSPFLDLLKSINEGITIYEPMRRTSQELTEFQDTVARLLEMERTGLVGRIYTQTREIAGAEYYDMAMVTGGGLTDEGKRILTEHQDPGSHPRTTS